MSKHSDPASLAAAFIHDPAAHGRNDYFGLIRELVARRQSAQGEARAAWQQEIDRVYTLIMDELQNNPGPPRAPVSFGTSGWRGILGKDIFARSVRQVTLAIVQVYQEADQERELAAALGVANLTEAKERGIVVGHDNRFGGEFLSRQICEVLSGHGFVVHYAGEATTGALSAATLMLKAAGSINLTPSHNPLEYGGFKYNAADAGPAAALITNRITAHTRRIIAENQATNATPDPALVRPLDALAAWQQLVRANRPAHGLDYDAIITAAAGRDDLVIAIDCVHGAARVDLARLLAGIPRQRLLLLRAEPDPTFGGVAPEPSTANLAAVVTILRQRPEPLKLGAIIDPDGDRIRFTDGDTEIDMNRFGALAYHYLHEDKGKRGMVAKTVATSNFANAIANALGEEVFEPRVGFKEFKPVIGQALVLFEESDGISLIGHTPEKDAYIGLLLALDLMISRNQNLGSYYREISERYGRFFPGRGGVTVSQQGPALTEALARLDRYAPGATLMVDGIPRRISEVITIDGRKMIMEDGGWLMIRPSGTEPKVRFYVEARSASDQDALLATAENLLKEIDLL